MTRRRLLAALLLAPLAGCQTDRPFTLFGYSAKRPFDENIKTVYVPVFTNVALQTSGNREIERQLTETVIKEIHTRTPFRVISDRSRADTELLGTVIKIDKFGQNRTQQNHVREAEIYVTAQVTWTDLRTGKVLSNPRSPRVNVEPVADPFDPNAPPLPPAQERERPYPVAVTGIGRLIHELGETNASANKMAVDQIAKQIVNMMEEPW